MLTNITECDIIISHERFGGDKLSEKEKDIIKKLCDTVPKLNKENQSYLVGVAEGMAIAKASSDKAEKEPVG